MRNPCRSESRLQRPIHTSFVPHVFSRLLQRQGIPSSTNGLACLGRARQTRAACDLKSLRWPPIPTQASKIQPTAVPLKPLLPLFSQSPFARIILLCGPADLPYIPSLAPLSKTPSESSTQAVPNTTPSQESRSLEFGKCDCREASAIVPADNCLRALRTVCASSKSDGTRVSVSFQNKLQDIGHIPRRRRSVGITRELFGRALVATSAREEKASTRGAVVFSPLRVG
jgi:hypothetical protein